MSHEVLRSHTRSGSCGPPCGHDQVEMKLGHGGRSLAGGGSARRNLVKRPLKIAKQIPARRGARCAPFCSAWCRGDHRKVDGGEARVRLVPRGKASNPRHLRRDLTNQRLEELGDFLMRVLWEESSWEAANWSGGEFQAASSMVGGWSSGRGRRERWLGKRRVRG